MSVMATNTTGTALLTSLFRGLRGAYQPAREDSSICVAPFDCDLQTGSRVCFPRVILLCTLRRTEEKQREINEENAKDVAEERIKAEEKRWEKAFRWKKEKRLTVTQ